MDELEGKVAVVTGAASGIGFALARRFGNEGMQVVLSDVDESELAGAVDVLTGEGVVALGVAADVAESGALDRVRDATLERFGAAHVVCNNAGIGGGGSISGDVDLAAWRRTFDVDVFGIVHGVRAFLPVMLEQGEGHIVNTASRQGLVSTPHLGAYGPAKFAAVALTEMLHDELHERGSRVSASVLCPGGVRTRMLPPPHIVAANPAIGPDRAALLTERYEMAVDPAEVAGLVVAAIRAQRLYVLTHSETIQWLADRQGRIVADTEVLGTLR